MDYRAPLLEALGPPPAAPARAPMADAELVVQLQQGSEAAFRTLVARYQGRVYRTALALLRSPEEAEDVAQEVFVEVYQTIGRFRGEAALSTWLYRLATSRALKNRRRARAKKRLAYVTSLLGLGPAGCSSRPTTRTRWPCLKASSSCNCCWRVWPACPMPNKWPSPCATSRS
ncbi:RNA polymerase sigma factor [Hymenobacter coccineus]|uniref:RNA polymerase sigma factor n=1 Tax=Hymenobacter coccineus TaxID=1908235 RepID=UPI0021CDC5A6|nr:sigma-70 family RNA polymerase sigma factor [Hymenobacter coccineus]